nr:restriction endonuclease subunit S [Pseudomaricurvus sp. HS19]
MGELVEIVGGGTPSKDNPEFWGGTIPWASVKDFKSSELHTTADYITDVGVKKSATNVIPAGNIIVPTRMALGKVAVNKVDMAINQDLKALIVKDESELSKPYLLRFLESKSEFIGKQGKGATVKGITLDVLRGLEIPLPPLTEQKRIAATLDKADAIRRKRQQAIQLADEFLRAVFLHMFGDPVTNPKGWEVKRLGEVVESQLGKMLSQKAKEGRSPKKYLRNANVRWRSFDLNDLLEMDFNTDEVKKFNLKNGDLLVCEGGEVGRCAIWRDNINDCYFQKALHRIRPNSKVLTSEYVQEYFFWMARLGGLSDSVSEVTFSHLTAEKLKSLKIPMPPLDRQLKFSYIYQKYERLCERNFTSISMGSDSFESISQKAFSHALDDWDQSH